MRSDREQALEAEIARIRALGLNELRTLWRSTFRTPPPSPFTKDLIARFICWHIQEQGLGGLDHKATKLLDGLARGDKPGADRLRRLKVGTVLVREYQGERHTVTVVSDGYVWRDVHLREPLDHRARHHRYGLERPKVLRGPCGRKPTGRIAWWAREGSWRCRQNLIVANAEAPRSSQR